MLKLNNGPIFTKILQWSINITEVLDVINLQAKISFPVQST